MTTKTVDEILHDIFAVGISAASIFVKNPGSRVHASSIIDLLNNTVLPIADTLLNPQAPAPPAS